MMRAMDDCESHLLVVDDDARLRALLRRYLSDNGFRVTVAADAAEARASLARFAFDLVVLDVMMPGESGLDLTRALRGEGGAPVLLLTAMAEPGDRVNGLEQGAEDYLAKPFGRGRTWRRASCASAAAASIRHAANCFAAATLCI